MPPSETAADPDLEDHLQDRARLLFDRTQELNEALDELRRQQARLVQAEKQAALAGLVAGMAHEMNTPIGTALTAASALDDAAEEVAQAFESGRLTRSDMRRFLTLARDAAPLILSSLQRSVRLIDSFKRLAVGDAAAERRRFDLRQPIDRVLTGFSPRARQEGHRLTAACPAGLVMDGFPEVLEQVLDGLIANALDHGLAPGRPGTVALLARGEDDTVELRCVDDGAGIAPDHLDRVFDPFFTTGRSRGASGLGLNIVHTAVTGLLGGTIRCDSQPGLGTTVTLRLPCRAPERLA